MYLADLTDAEYSFKCEFAGDACEYWDYDFSVERWDDKYSRNLNWEEIQQLRSNCRRILQATEGC